MGPSFLWVGSSAVGRTHCEQPLITSDPLPKKQSGDDPGFPLPEGKRSHQGNDGSLLETGVSSREHSSEPPSSPILLRMTSMGVNKSADIISCLMLITCRMFPSHHTRSMIGYFFKGPDPSSDHSFQFKQPSREPRSPLRSSSLVRAILQRTRPFVGSLSPDQTIFKGTEIPPQTAQSRSNEPSKDQSGPPLKHLPMVRVNETLLVRGIIDDGR